MKTNELKKCNYCGKEFEPRKLTDVEGDGSWLVCEECLDNYYTTCDHCGHYTDVDGVTRITPTAYSTHSTPTLTDTYVCIECLREHYERCGHCGGWFSSHDVHDTEDGYICDDCLTDYYYQCIDCGEWIHEDNIYISQYDNEPRCEYCHDNHEYEHTENYLYDYHGGPSLPLVSAYNKPDMLSLGFELELSFTDSQDRRNFLTQSAGLFEAGLFKCERDSSISDYDCEVISAPFAITEFNYMMEKTNKLIQIAKENGAVTDYSTGLHVHVATTRKSRNSELHNDCGGLTGLLLHDCLKYRYKYSRSEFDELTQRVRYSNYCSLARIEYYEANKLIKEYNEHYKIKRDSSPNINLQDTIKGVIDKWSNIDHNGGHGTALNYGPGNKNDTFEFRLFAAKLDVEHIKRACCFSLGLFDYCAKLARRLLKENQNIKIKHPYIATCIKRGAGLIEEVKE